MTTIGIAAAKAQLSALVERAAAGELVTITRNGAPIARLVGMSAVEFRYLNDAELRRDDAAKACERAIDHAFPVTSGTINGSQPKPASMPRIAPPGDPNPPSPRLKPQVPGLTLADLLKAAR